MLSFLPGLIIGFIAGLLFFINVVVAAFIVVILGLIKYVIPLATIRNGLTKMQHGTTCIWTDINGFIMSLPAHITWELQGSDVALHPDHWYFVIANHQSWIDILVLQKIFNRKIPLLKFFLKQELLWSLPMGGLACWMLDFPFMKRYTKAQLKKNPALRHKDLETTRKACERFKLRPTTVVNFLEGTRFTREKQQNRSSPYQNLLRPSAGGLAFVTNELKDFIHEVIDVTIVYDHPDPSFWHLLCGKISKVIVHYEVIPLSKDQYGDYFQDVAFRKAFQGWLNQRWREKDALITQIACAKK